MRIKTVAMAVHVAVQTKQMEQVQMRAMGTLVDTTTTAVVDVHHTGFRKLTAKERLLSLFDRIRQFIKKH